MSQREPFDIARAAGNKRDRNDFSSSTQEPHPLPHTSADALWVRIYYEDTDFSRRVYHASYLRFLERGRTEWLRKRGFAHRDLAENSGVVFAVRSLKIEYL